MELYQMKILNCGLTSIAKIRIARIEYGLLRIITQTFFTRFVAMLVS
jgi:hypothetical protein